MSEAVSNTCSELYHYTTAAGLQGIVEHQQLWATNIAYLNDGEEHTGFFDRRLPFLLDAPVKAALNELALTENGKSVIAESGGIEEVRRAVMNDFSKRFRAQTLQFNNPFVASFCRPSLHDPDDGLLSQWRGYGVDGGYAIVFDTKGVERLSMEEAKTFNHQFFGLGDVHYYDNQVQEMPAYPEVLEYEKAVQDAVYKFMLTQDIDSFEPMFIPLTALSCHHKHRGFREEQEVRLVAIPIGDELYELANKDGDNRPRKDVHFRVQEGVLIPYIKLFGKELSGEAVNFPIKKIIVGPHPDRIKRQKAIEMLLRQTGMKAEVTISEIPYIGR